MAAHCNEPVLHAAAYTAFESHIQKLLEQGQRELALQLWGSVVEIKHLPIGEPTLAQVQGMPPMRWTVCCQAECVRCEHHRGGYQFPWIGIWTKPGTLVQHGASAVEAWQRYGEIDGTMDLLQVNMVASGLQADDLCPRPWFSTLQLASPSLGCATLEAVVLQWRTWQCGSQTWINPASDRQLEPLAALAEKRQVARRALEGWLALARLHPRECLSPACLGCGTPSRRICATCHQSFCQSCLLSPRRPYCCDDDEGDDQGHFEVPALRPGQRDADLFRLLITRGRVTPAE